MIHSDMSSEYKADIDISTFVNLPFDDKFKLELRVYGSVRKSISEYMVAIGLYRKALSNELRDMLIFIDVVFASKSYEELIWSAKGSENLETPSKSGFGLDHGDVPVLL